MRTLGNGSRTCPTESKTPTPTQQVRLLLKQTDTKQTNTNYNCEHNRISQIPTREG